MTKDVKIPMSQKYYADQFVTVNPLNGKHCQIVDVAPYDPETNVYETSYYVESDGTQLLFTESQLEFTEEDEMLMKKQHHNIFREWVLNEHQDDISYATMPRGALGVKFAVWANEGKGYPHFHFYQGCDINKGIPRRQLKEGGGCICILEPKYFSHNKHTRRLTRKEMEAMIEYLQEPEYPRERKTVWQRLVDEWNDNNPEYAIPRNTPMPYYTYTMPNYNDRKGR